MFYFMHGSIFNSSVAWYAETQYLFVHLKYGFLRSRRYMKDPPCSGRLLYSTSEKTPKSLSCSMISSCFLTTYILYLLSIVNCYHSMIHTETNGRGIKNEGERKRRNIRMMSRRIILFLAFENL